MNSRKRWKARRDAAKQAACTLIMQQAHAEICQRHFPDWNADKVATAWSLMAASGLVEEMMSLAEGLSDEQWEAVRKVAEQAGGEA
jgi:hypothetical protein